MRRINIEKLKPKPYKFKALFKKHNITIGMLAKCLNRDYRYTGQMLNGYFRMTQETKDKLDTLAQQIKSDEKAGRV